MSSEMERSGTASPVAWRALTVNEAIRRHPQTVSVFNRFGIDACCGGAVTIAEAAARDGADLRALVAELSEVAGVEA